MDPFQRSELGRTGLKVPRLGLGTSPLGRLDSDLSDRRALATIRRALALGITYIDTAPAYGFGRAELRLGHVLANVHRDSYIISTKVGYTLKDTQGLNFKSTSLRELPELTRDFDFSRDGVLRCFEGSLQRLRLDMVDILYIHMVPPEHYQQAIREAFPALAELRAQGVVKAIGAGMNNLQLLLQFIREGDLDCFLLPDRYHLLDQSALSEFLPLCVEKGISIIMGTPYDGGRILGRPEYTPQRDPTPPETLQRVRRLWAVCDRHRVPVRAAALQFVSAHPAAVSVIPGPRSVQETKDNISMMQHPIPPEFWDELRREGLIPKEAPTPK